jgi:hypothetical protein
VFTGPAGAEALAFETQECNLVEWIDGPQTSVELEAVNDPDGIAKPDVLGAQIAVPFDDATVTCAPDKHPAIML